MENSDCWSPADVALLQNQEARAVRFIGSLVLEHPPQHGYPSGKEVQILLPVEQVEVAHGYQAIMDVNSEEGNRYVKFWIGAQDYSWGQGEDEDPQQMFDGQNKAPSGQRNVEVQDTPWFGRFQQVLERLPTTDRARPQAPEVLPPISQTRSQVPDVLPPAAPVIDLVSQSPQRYGAPSEDQQPKGRSYAHRAY